MSGTSDAAHTPGLGRRGWDLLRDNQAFLLFFSDGMKSSFPGGGGVAAYTCLLVPLNLSARLLTFLIHWNAMMWNHPGTALPRRAGWQTGVTTVCCSNSTYSVAFTDFRPPTDFTGIYLTWSTLLPLFYRMQMHWKADAKIRFPGFSDIPPLLADTDPRIAEGGPITPGDL